MKRETAKRLRGGLANLNVHRFGTIKLPPGTNFQAWEESVKLSMLLLAEAINPNAKGLVSLEQDDLLLAAICLLTHALEMDD